jgi:RND family efflux transporter MFP subunit
VQNLTARPGDLIAAGTAVATIGALGDLRARFGVDPAMAARIHPGQPVEITPINAATKILSSVSGVDPQVDATTRLASVFTRVPGGQGVGAGEPLRATIGVGGTSQGITIPYSALLDDGGRSYVFVVEGGVAKSRDVSPGNSAGDRIQILKGLQPGERVVTEGGTALEDGMKVREDVPGAAVAK